MKRFVPFLVVSTIALAFVGTLVFLWQKSRAKPVSWKTQKPYVADIVKKTVATGAIVPRREIAVKPRVSGVVEEIFVEPGQLVKEGAPIAKIRIIPDMVSLNSAESAVSTARINLANAERELKRNTELHKSGVVADTDYQRLQLDYDLRRQELDSAQSNLQLIKEGASRKTGKVSNVVTSTVAGQILEVPVKEGESVTETNTFNAGSTIASIADMSDMIFQGKVDESEVGKIKEGMELQIKVGALQDRIISGKLEHIAPKGVSTDGTIQFEIKAAIQAPSDVFVRAGYSANADIVLDRRTQVLAIRESLLQFQDGKPYVEVEVSPQKFERRSIEVGISDGVQIEIKSGLDKEASVKDPVSPSS
jgi:HlyD family secretion protein